MFMCPIRALRDHTLANKQVIASAWGDVGKALRNVLQLWKKDDVDYVTGGIHSPQWLLLALSGRQQITVLHK